MLDKIKLEYIIYATAGTGFASWLATNNISLMFTFGTVVLVFLIALRKFIRIIIKDCSDWKDGNLFDDDSNKEKTIQEKNLNKKK